MKRIYSLLLLTVLATGAFAQRQCDLAVTNFVQPTTSTVVNPGNTAFNIDVVITNLGPDSLKYTSDSILWYATISNAPINWTFGSSSGAQWLRYHKQLKMNDTMHMTFSGIGFSSYSATADSMRNLCWFAFPRGTKPSDTIKDPSTTNNTKCVSFMFKKTSFPGAINPSSATSLIMFYPNPAQDLATLTFATFAYSDVKISILDMTGREIKQINKGKLAEGNYSIPIDLKDMPNGTYSYQLYIDKEVTSGKFNVVK